MRGRYDVIVVGAGAAGLFAAIRAASRGSRVLILEHMGQAGKKILSTGNGKCNFTNQKQGIAYYRGKNPAFVLPVFAQFGLEDTLLFFERIGVQPKEKRGGYYPASGQASSVVETLMMECRRVGVSIAYGIGIREIKKEGGAFRFLTKQGVFESAACILATGGKAAKKTGSDGSGYLYIERFGHALTDIVPALVQLQGKQSFLKDIAGIRAESRVTLFVDREKVAEDFGELQLTEFGISGIPVFQVSRYASYALEEGKAVRADLDFLPEWAASRAREQIRRRFWDHGEGKSAIEALVGLFPGKLCQLLLAQCRVPPEKPARDCTAAECDRLAKTARRLPIDIIGTKGFDAAQVTAGGVDTDEICPETMESRLVPGLYFAGEVVDIDGMCGGYNLQWAWSSGWVAGNSAARRAAGARIFVGGEKNDSD